MAKKIALPKHSISMFSQHPLVCLWGKWVAEIKCFDQHQRKDVREDESLLRITKQEK